MQKFISFILLILGTILITLKLTNQITWSWWIILLPFYINFIIVGIIYLLIIMKEFLKDKYLILLFLANILGYIGILYLFGVVFYK